MSYQTSRTNLSSGVVEVATVELWDRAKSEDPRKSGSYSGYKVVGPTENEDWSRCLNPIVPVESLSIAGRHCLEAIPLARQWLVHLPVETDPPREQQQSALSQLPWDAMSTRSVRPEDSPGNKLLTGAGRRGSHGVLPSGLPSEGTVLALESGRSWSSVCDRSDR